jgi:hypothetical protein
MNIASSFRRRLALWICPELGKPVLAADDQLLAQVFRSNNVPSWSRNVRLRTFLTEVHRQMPIEDARAEAFRRFGAAAPSKSSIHRYWARLDHLLANEGGGAVSPHPTSKKG